MATSSWKITCFAPPPLNAAMKCAPDPKISSHPTSKVTPSPATPGSIIEKIPNTMKSTAAAIYHPVTFLATPIGLRKPSAGFNVAMRHLHAILFFGIGRRSEPAADGPGSPWVKHGDSIPIPSRWPPFFSFLGSSACDPSPCAAWSCASFRCASVLLLLDERLADLCRQRLDPLDERSRLPQLFVRIPRSVCKHSRAPHTVLRDPEDLRLGVFRSLRRQMRHGREQYSRIFLRLSRCAMASRALIQIHLPPCNQVLVRRRKRIRHLRRFASHRCVHRSPHHRTLKPGRRQVAAHLGKS